MIAKTKKLDARERLAGRRELALRFVELIEGLNNLAAEVEEAALAGIITSVEAGIASRGVAIAADELDSARPPLTVAR